MKKYRYLLAALTFVLVLSAAVAALAYPADTSKCPVNPAGQRGPHLYEEIARTPATCTQPGSITWECQGCKKTVTETIPATGHIWSNWLITKEPTCTQPGEQSRECRNDRSHKETQTLPALGHDWGNWKTAAEPGCTTEGTETRTCRRCKMTETRTIPALGHKWGAWKTTKAPGCTSEGVESRTCGRCGLTESHSLPALGHDWGPYMPDVPPTCTDPGWDNKTCKRDPSHLWYQEVPALGHLWGEWVRVKEPSPLGPGLEERVCERCGIKEQKEIPYEGDAMAPLLILTVVQTSPAKEAYEPDDKLTFDVDIINAGNVPLERPSLYMIREGASSQILTSFVEVDTTIDPADSISYAMEYTVDAADEPLLEISWSADAWVLGTYSAAGDEGYVTSEDVIMQFPVRIPVKERHPELTLTFLGGDASGLKEGDYASYEVEVKNTGDTLINFQSYEVVPYADDGHPMPEDYSNWSIAIGYVLKPDESFKVVHLTRICSGDTAAGEIRRQAYGMGVCDDGSGGSLEIASNLIEPVIPLDPVLPPPPVRVEPTEPTLILSVTLNDPADPFTTDLSGDTPPVTYDVSLTNIWDWDLDFNRITAHGETRYPAVGTLQGGIPAYTQIDGFVFNESEILPGTGTETLKGEVEITFIAYAVDPTTGIEYASNPVTLRHGIKTDGFDDWVPPAETSVSLFKKVISDPILPQGYMLDETVRYEIQVTNDSEVPLDITVYDPLSGTDPIGVLTAMAPHETRSVFFDYCVCGPDIDNKQIENQARAEWVDPAGAGLSALSNKCVVLTAVPDDIYGIKAIVSDPKNGEYYTVGETIKCQITLYNPTALTYKDVELWDALFSMPDDIEPTAKWDKLEPYGAVTVHFDFLVTELNVGYDYTNAAKFNATGNLDLYVTGITNTVTAKTGKEPPKKHYDGGFVPPVGDGLTSCVRTLTGKGEGVYDCTLEYCGDHYTIEKQVRALLNAARSEEARISAWQQAQTLWRNALDNEYRILTKAGTQDAPAAAEALKLNDEKFLEAYKTLLTRLMPHDPEAVERAVAEQLMNRVADLCYMLHNAPKAPKDSLLIGGYAAIPGAGEADCGFRVLKTEGSKVTYEAVMCVPHAGIDSTVTALIEADAMAGARAAVFLKAQRAWLTSLDSKVNAMYKAASAEDRAAVAAYRTALGRMLESKKDLIELLYPNDPLTVNEIMANSVRDEMITLCGF